MVTVSGDGLIHEVVNGLCNRADWESDFMETITIGCIPGGTANGLVKSILYASDEEYGIEEATFLVAKGRRSKMDLTEITGEWEKKKIFSFLSTAWAVIADCDINSEVIRCIGEARFTVWGVWRCLFTRTYNGTLDYNGFQLKNKNEYKGYREER